MWAEPPFSEKQNPRDPNVYKGSTGVSMAVTVGFEPTVGVNLHNISSVAPSAARTRHRG